MPGILIIQAGRHQSKQKPVETKLLAFFRRFFAEILTNCAEFCKFPPTSAKNLTICRILRNLWGFPRKFCEMLRAFLFRLVVVSTGGVPLQYNSSAREITRPQDALFARRSPSAEHYSRAVGRGHLQFRPARVRLDDVVLHTHRL